MTVYCAMIGGLGNQMFQYAAAHALSLRLQTDLKLDISAYDARVMHQGFELQRVFNIHAGIASKHEIRLLLGWQSLPGVSRLFSRTNMGWLRRKAWQVEPHFRYWDGFSLIQGTCYLTGYWQSEKYFSDMADSLRADFSFKQPMNCTNAELAGQIADTNAVSLHVRRGDYVSDAKTHATHGICSVDYYRKAVDYIASRAENPHFFVFSDDMEWVRKELKLPYPCVYVNQNQGADSFNDLRLMSLCQHHIIANSSFSWWGAWLNAYPGKIVVAPGRWFVHDTDTRDLYPAGWVKL